MTEHFTTGADKRIQTSRDELAVQLAAVRSPVARERLAPVVKEIR